MLHKLAPRPSLQDWPPYGLVGLWDMLKVNAAVFCDAILLIANLESLSGAPSENEPLDPEDKEVIFSRAKALGVRATFLAQGSPMLLSQGCCQI